ncbi:ATP binding protein, putative [Ricinus communis]|uniref:ATP binding protein, putative n=1 Tax=Ricinus communis TaxID=3988 RepID=B9SXJ9_RICCO|nr:ATP binding protein, putative [Ricinus communis]|eukprot:XP_002530718.1 probable L-type lectin-domain containing receptor kinase S.5 [Ricinus communis]
MYCSWAIKFFLKIALLGSAVISVECLSFTYPKFETENETDLIRHNSYIVLNAIQVTPDVSGGSITNLSGRALYKEPFKLWGKSKKGISRTRASFNSTFVLNISPRTNPGGEGVAFILTEDSDLPENSQGQWLGIVNENTNGNSQAKIIGIEFDTRKSFPRDVDDNHVGLDVNSIYSIRQEPLGIHGVDLSAGIDVMVQIQYDGETLILSIGQQEKNFLFSVPIDLSAYLPEEVFVGFSGSTSNYTELNCVRSWEFYSSVIKEESSLLWVKIVAPIGAALLIGITFYICRRWKAEKHRPVVADPSIEEEINGSSMAPRKFTFKELEKATAKFNSQNMIGKGGFGAVYKGILNNEEVAVKRISRESTQGKQEFIAEVTTIGNFHHKNLVKLIGWCYERNEFLLVYEYMPNGSLDKLIFREDTAEEQEKTLDWGKRINIILGIAQALDYLHNGCEKRVLHRDIKTSNIMLDSEFNAKLGDFGLARMVKQREQTHHTTRELAGTHGYMAPECFFTARATVETDVYAFGVLLLEVVCGKKPGNQNEQSDYNSRIVCWVWELYRLGRILDAADRKSIGVRSDEEMECVLILGLACCNTNQEQRPSMKIVLQVLTGEAPLPIVPPEMPAFVWQTTPPPIKESDCSLTGSQLTPFSEITGR